MAIEARTITDTVSGIFEDIVPSNIVEAAATPAFLALDVDGLVALVGHDDVRVESEDIVFDAAIRWLQHEPAVRKVPEVVYRVMKDCVRLPLVLSLIHI